MLGAGFDPGKAGAWAIIDPRPPAKLVMVRAFPLLESGEVDMVTLALQVRAFHELAPIGMAMLEWPNARESNGRNSTRTFGIRCGELWGMLCTLGIRTEKKDPATWKRTMGLTQDKAEVVRLAEIAFPDRAHLFSRPNKKKKGQRILLDGNAEAAFLAVLAGKVISR